MRTRSAKTPVRTPTGAAVLLLAALSLQPVSQAADKATAPAGVLHAINFGGDSVGYFEADPGGGLRDAGSVWTTNIKIDTKGVANAAPAAVYQTGLFGNFQYTATSLEPGRDYLVRLHFAETIATQPGQRQSDFLVNQTQVLFGYDVYGVAGAPNRAVAEDVLVRADMFGTLHFDFKPTPGYFPVVVAGTEILLPTETPAPAAWWSFDELAGSRAEDARGDRHATIEGPARTVGRLGGALQFDGQDDYVRADGVQNLTNQPFSVLCWIKGSTPGRVIVSLEGGLNLLRAAPGTGYLGTELVRGQPTYSSVRIADGLWHQIGLTYGDTAGARLYVDGIAVLAYAGRIGAMDRLYFGCGYNRAAGTFWSGLIDDIRVYSRILTAQEIRDVGAQAQRVETSYYYIGPNERVPVRIDLDKIGAVPAKRDAKVTDSVVRTFLGKINLPILYTQPGGAIVGQLPQALSRLELVQFARQASLRADSPFQSMGLVVTPGKAQTPMFLTDEFIAKFTAAATDAEIEALNRNYAVQLIERNQYRPKQCLLKVTSGSPGDALEIANLYHEHPLTEYAHPNFLVALELRGHVPNDKFFALQWHLSNTGQSGGTADADIDAPEAWEITTGDPNLIIAVIDGGFDVSHPDLKANLWTNPRDKPNRIDDDGDGRIDDVHGWNFLGDSDDHSGGRWEHGTAAAGCAGAKGDNALGVSGVCPNCRLMLLTTIDETHKPYWPVVTAIDYAHYHGAAIITNSWGYPSDHPCPPNARDAITDATTNGRNGLGCILLFAMSNEQHNDDLDLGICTLDNVIAISAANNRDCIKDMCGADRDTAGFGNCLDLLAPTHRGTRWIATTDLTGRAGYNSDCPPNYVPVGTDLKEPPDYDYTVRFSGTSAACPIAAGVAGLVLSVAADMNSVQVQRLLQDTADKIDPSLAKYSDRNGFSLGPNGVATHGYGRINAFEAVRVVAPKKDAGRGGVDLFVRDNRLDWGNTEQPSHVLFESTRGSIPYWESPDIKVVVESSQTKRPTNSADFDAVSDENPRRGAMNRVYVRVRNRGPRTATSVKVKLYWCSASPSLPPLPADFWTRFPEDSTDTTRWKSLGTLVIAEVPYSGSSVAGKQWDPAQIASFDLDLKQYPSLGPGCLLAIIHSDQDPVSGATRGRLTVDAITPNDNNVAQRNVVIQGSP